MVDSFKIWIMAFRPKTLTAAISPVLIGTAMAFGDGVHHFSAAFVCLFAALMIQIGTNLANDYFDFKKGADTDGRIGPTRVTQAGLIKPRHIIIGIIAAFGLSALACIWLVDRGGIPMAIIGVLGILSGIFYTAGPKPLGYLGLGEVFVFIFFGPVAVAGTYYVQSFELNYAVILAGIAPGLLSVAILAVNNYRDIESDSKSGKKTLAVRFGRSFAQIEYLAAILIAALIPVIIYSLIHDHLAILWASTISLMAIPAFQTVIQTTSGPALNKTLAYTGKLLLIYSILFSIGWVV